MCVFLNLSRDKVKNTHGTTPKVFTGITESRKSFSQSRQCSTDLNESFGFHLKILVSL